MKIYFAGSITGGRQKASDYSKMVSVLEKYGEVLTKTVGDVNLTIKGENVSAKEIYSRDVNWLNECDILFADITVPSLGVGYELAYAESKHKKIICMYEKDKNVSSLIIGNSYYKQIPYSNIEEVLEKIDNICKQESK